ncbi:MAG: hypothetical protein PWR30_307 [Candidatus Woesearchaeota archaeon]|nr:hypothetical protein [Candidatus Woesearchaeota archaeon]MDK2908271.1 hypothetical protein [Candidatus Woesearchaeota archaeon]
MDIATARKINKYIKLLGFFLGMIQSVLIQNQRLSIT